MSSRSRSLVLLCAAGILVAGGGPGAAARSQTASERPAPEAACVALVVPNVQGVEGNASDFGRGIREVFASYLTGPSIRVELLEARLPAQAAEEAKQKSCAHLLTATLVRKRGGGGFGLGKVLGRTGSAVAWQLPGGGVGGAVVRGVAAAGSQALTDLASTTKARDEMRLEYRFAPHGGGKPILEKEEKLKASSDGEDLVTPMVQKAAESIAAVIPR